MKNRTLVPSYLLASLALAACGSAERGGTPVSSEAEAAQAAYRMQETGDSLDNRQSQGLTAAQVSDLPGIGPDGVSATTTHTVSGASGEAVVEVEAVVAAGDVQARYTVEYKDFSTNGIDFIDGRVAHVSRVETGGSGVAVTHEVKGQVEIWGTQAASLDVDVALSVVVGGAGAAAVTVQLDGTVTADGETFRYEGSEFDLRGGVY